MCRAVQCNNCGKTTSAGCGRHIEQVKATVLATQWCTCNRNTTNNSGFLATLLGKK